MRELTRFVLVGLKVDHRRVDDSPMWNPTEARRLLTYALEELIDAPLPETALALLIAAGSQLDVPLPSHPQQSKPNPAQRWGSGKVSIP